MRRVFRLMAWPFRRVVTALRRENPDFYTEVLEKIESFDSPEDAMSWLQSERAKIRLDRIAGMRAWERQTRLTIWSSVALIAVQLAVLQWLPVIVGGAFQVVTIGFILMTQDASVRKFVDRRDQLLKDLEDDPDAEVWWYDAFTRKGKK